jgi:MFS transporter, Spinster family, sphingosine-1-phosphate transporter
MKAFYRNYLLILLMVILAFNYVDRLALGLVLQDIKADFHLSDTQLGLLSGMAFALFYSLMGLPIARWADRGNRVHIITLTTGLWSIFVALCGFATNFIQLLLARIVVAVGEAGCMPPAHSLIADYFSRAERPRAVAIYMLGSTLSMLVGYYLAGWLNEQYGWQTMFKILAIPGVVLAALAWISLREPRREAPATVASPSTNASQHHHTIKEVVVALWNNVTFRNLWFTFSVMSFFSHGVVQWQPSYFIRTFGMRTDELGLWLTLIYGVGGTIGTYIGGVLSSRFAAGNEALQLRATGWLYAGYGVLMVAVFLSPNPYVAIGLNTIGTIGASLASGPLFGTIQTVVPARMRATSITLIYLLGNLIGMGLGPLATGALSDLFSSWAGDLSLRYALLTLCPISLWGSWYLLVAAKTVARDVYAVEAADGVAHQGVST